MPEQTITVGKYLLRRLKEIGVDTIFGVPGDYNMVIDDGYCSLRTAFSHHRMIIAFSRPH